MTLHVFPVARVDFRCFVRVSRGDGRFTSVERGDVVDRLDVGVLVYVVTSRLVMGVHPEREFVVREYA